VNAFIIFLIFFASFLNSGDSASNSAIFSSIYERGEWGVDENQKGNSGTGSDPQNAKIYLSYLRSFLDENHIQSVVDLGCGDWRLGRLIDWNGKKYIGIDVVESVIN
jgi:hypothetical protein